LEDLVKAETSYNFPLGSEGATLVMGALRLTATMMGIRFLASALELAAMVFAIIAIVNLVLHGPVIGFGIAGVGLFIAGWFLKKVNERLVDIMAVTMKRIQSLIPKEEGN
jgi:hypothetical protein